MPHVAFIAQQRPVESIITVQRMIIWHREGTALRIVVERTYHRFQIISIEIGISIETHHQIVAALLSHNPLKEELARPPHTFLLACPSASGRTAVYHHHGKAGRLPEQLQTLLVLFKTIAPFLIVDTDVKGKFMMGLPTQSAKQTGQVIPFGQCRNGYRDMMIAG